MSHSLLGVEPKSKRGKLARNRGVFQLNLPSMRAGIKLKGCYAQASPRACACCRTSSTASTS